MEERIPEGRKPYEFIDPMTRGEHIFALFYLAMHAVALPLLLGLLLAVWPGETPPDDTTLNVFYYAAGLLLTFIFLWKYLRRAFDVLIDNWRGVLLSFVAAYVLDLLLSWVMQLVFVLLGDQMGTTPNTEAVTGMAQQNYNMMLGMAVFMAPIVEEPLFRGGIFGGLHKRSRALAYIVSVAAFSVYHVWQFIYITGDWSYLLFAVQYIPVSAALCYAYEKSGSIWTPIFFHMMINAISMWATTLL